MTYLPNRKGEGELVFNVDHCFSIKGQGTVLTGTILQGSVKVNDVSLIPDIFHYTSSGVNKIFKWHSITNWFAISF